ncbi:MAG: hypothetical protein IJI37_01005 [Opitutales bacterium]|nr:hypothetical protein [Opitutales bacterium]
MVIFVVAYNTENEIIKSNLNQFKKIALLAYFYLKSGVCKTPSAAWEKACNTLNVKESIRKKGCPKAAFVGLFENNKSKNASYARALADLYKKAIIPVEKTKEEKWDIFRKNASKYGMHDVAQNNNGQLDVVEALFENKLLK